MKGKGSAIKRETFKWTGSLSLGESLQKEKGRRKGLKRAWNDREGKGFTGEEPKRRLLQKKTM